MIDRPLSERVLARQIATNAVGAWTRYIFGRSQMTFQDAEIANAIEQHLLGVGAVSLDDAIVDAMELHPGAPEKSEQEAEENPVPQPVVDLDPDNCVEFG